MTVSGLALLKKKKKNNKADSGDGKGGRGIKQENQNHSKQVSTQNKQTCFLQTISVVLVNADLALLPTSQN